jgi:hypothetical protein
MYMKMFLFPVDTRFARVFILVHPLVSLFQVDFREPLLKAPCLVALLKHASFDGGQVRNDV